MYYPMGTVPRAVSQAQSLASQKTQLTGSSSFTGILVLLAGAGGAYLLYRKLKRK